MKNYQREAIFTLHRLLFPLSGLSVFVVVFVCVKIKQLSLHMQGSYMGGTDVQLHELLTSSHDGGWELTLCPSHFMIGEMCPGNLSIGDWVGPRAHPDFSEK